MTTISSERIDAILSRHEELQGQMAAGDLAPDKFVELSKEYSELEPVAETARELKRLRDELAALDEMLADPEMKEMAEAEAEELKAAIPEAERSLAVKLLPKDAADDRPAMLELRAGTGGDEAALFAGDLLRMYQRYAEEQGWGFELISASGADVGGYKEVVANVTGKGVFAKMKFESGVHRVQRVPVTESGGRIHTSAATVAVLPEPEEVDVQIDEADLRIDVFRASGPGGGPGRPPGAGPLAGMEDLARGASTLRYPCRDLRPRMRSSPVLVPHRLRAQRSAHRTQQRLASSRRRAIRPSSGPCQPV